MWKDDYAIAGCERASMGVTITSLFTSYICVENHKDVLLSKLPKDHYIHDIDDIRMDTLTRALSGFGIDKYIGHKTRSFGMQLNTAYKLGSDPIKLFARLHGQCEIHCYFNLDDADFICNIIQQGLDIGLYRYDLGWEKLLTGIQSIKNNKNYRHVVCSFSVTESFPNDSVAGYDEEKYYKLSYKKQWNIAISELVKEKGLCISPNNWEDFYFDYNETIFDLIRPLEKKS